MYLSCRRAIQVASLPLREFVQPVIPCDLFRCRICMNRSKCWRCCPKQLAAPATFQTLVTSPSRQPRNQKPSSCMLWVSTRPQIVYTSPSPITTAEPPLKKSSFQQKNTLNSFTMYLLPCEFSPLTWPARS